MAQAEFYSDNFRYFSRRDDPISAELIEQTLRTWQPYYQTALTPEDALYIIMSVGRLFDVLSRGDVA